MAESRPAAATLATLCGLVGCGGIALADDAPPPDMEFLEYLGSWDGSDEDWELLADAAETAARSAEDNQADAQDGKASAEKDDES